MKWIGALLFFLISLSFGWMAGKNEKKRTEECEAFLEFFVYIQNQVSYFLAPTKLMYKNFHNEVLKKNGFLDALCAHESDEVYFDVWENALRESRGNLKLSEEQFEILYQSVSRGNGKTKDTNAKKYQALQNVGFFRGRIGFDPCFLMRSSKAWGCFFEY